MNCKWESKDQITIAFEKIIFKKPYLFFKTTFFLFNLFLMADIGQVYGSDPVFHDLDLPPS